MPIERVDELDVEEFERRLEHDYERQFAGARALLELLRSRPSIAALATDLPAFVVAATFSRSVKTFRASIELCRTGFAEQAAMLNRSLFEDMAVAYWVRKRGQPAVEMLTRHHDLVLEQHREALELHDRADEAEDIEPLTVEARRELEREFGKYGPWFGKGGLHRVLSEVEEMWPNDEARRLLWRMYALAHRFNTLLLHHSTNALNQGVARRADDQIAFSVGPSDRNVEGALLSAYYPFSQLALLVHAGDDRHKAFQALIEHDLPAFIRLDQAVIAATGRNDLCPCDSGRKFKQCHGR